MKRGFYTIMSAQFFSSLADNALFVTAVELLKADGAPEWQRAALVPMFALFYVVLAPFVGAFADSRPKGEVMLISNTIKVVGCLMMLFGGRISGRAQTHHGVRDERVHAKQHHQTAHHFDGVADQHNLAFGP